MIRIYQFLYFSCLGLVLHQVENGLGNSVKWLKDWHETMFNHTNVRTKQCHE